MSRNCPKSALREYNVTDIGHLSALGVDTKFADCACCDESFLNA